MRKLIDPFAINSAHARTNFCFNVNKPSLQGRSEGECLMVMKL